MEEFIVLILSIVAIIFVVCGFKNRRKHREQDEKDRIGNRIERGNMHALSNNNSMEMDLFKDQLSKAGFRDETIEDMRAKILEMKGSVSFSDAVNIIRELDPIMKLRKDYKR